MIKVCFMETHLPQNIFIKKNMSQNVEQKNIKDELKSVMLNDQPFIHSKLTK